mgnify:FL=1
MKSFFNINGEVDEAMLEKFINIHKESEGKEIVILFDSIGGYSHIWQQIIEVIDDIENCTLIAWNEISSSAFDIFFLSKCKKKVVDSCVGMSHLWWFTIHTNPYRKKWLSIRVKEENIINSTNKYIKFLKRIWVSKQKIKWYKTDYDVSFSAKELRKMIKKL